MALMFEDKLFWAKKGAKFNLETPDDDDAFRRWWPYTPKKPVYTIEDCIREVKEDAFGCFWG